MQNFTGFEYLLIDLANQADKDKLTFQNRIEWAKDTIPYMESLADTVGKTKPLYLKACMAIRKAMNKQPMGHMVAMDAVCSGLQIMSVLTNCESGARATGLINPDIRSDAYGEVTQTMEKILGGSINISRDHAKKATMTAFYGSKAEPINTFGEDTKELEAFYKTLEVVAPGAWALLEVLVDSWEPYALQHSWTLPDGFSAIVKVEDTEEHKIEVDELDHATFTYYLSVNKGKKKGVSNAANVIQSIDAYILRSMHRRCNYDVKVVLNVLEILKEHYINKIMGIGHSFKLEGQAAYYYDLYKKTGLVDVVILPYITKHNIEAFSNDFKSKLFNILEGMSNYNSFELVTIHDSFASHPNNVNHVRYQYKEILADIAESDLLKDILTQLYRNNPQSFQYPTTSIAPQIRNSNYSLS